MAERRRKTPPRAQCPELPTFDQMLALMLTHAGEQLNRLKSIRWDDGEWNDDDDDANFTAALALSHIERMKAMAFKSYNDFAPAWYQVAAAINLADRHFSRKNSAYGRTMADLKLVFQLGPELVELCEKPPAGELSAA